MSLGGRGPLVRGVVVVSIRVAWSLVWWVRGPQTPAGSYVPTPRLFSSLVFPGLLLLLLE